MLLYYFADKNELLTATIEHIATRMAARLDQIGGTTTPRPFAVLLEDLWQILRTDSFKPYMHLWLELAARAARHDQPYQAIAHRITTGFLAWAEARLAVDAEAHRGPQAARLLAHLDGANLLDAVGCAEAADDAIEAAGSIG